MEKDRGLPVYEPPVARDLSGGGISGQDPLGLCSNGGFVADLLGKGGCQNGSIVGNCRTGFDFKSSGMPGGFVA
jgi:hypothetical protein